MPKTTTHDRGDLEDHPDMSSIAADIRMIRRSAENLHRLGERFPALSKNAARIMASLKMIELSVPGLETSSGSEED